MTQRILVIDDEGEMLQPVLEHLRQSGYKVLVACDGATALHILRSERPALVLLAIAPPDRDKWEGIGVVTAGVDLVAMPMVMFVPRLHDRGNGKPHTAGWSSNMDDDLGRCMDPAQVVTWVRGLLHRAQREVAPLNLIRVGSLTIDRDRSRAEVGNTPVRLTQTEFSLLCALAEQPGRALTRGELIETGLGCSYEGMERTVDSHIKNLRRKLDDAGGAAYLVETVFGIGYRLADRDSA